MAATSTARQYSGWERLTLSGLFLAAACFLVWMAAGLLQTSWQSYALDQRFERDGVQTQGFVSGFRYVSYTGKYAHRNTGHYPVVSIETPKGAFQIATSYAHPLNKAQQDELLWKKVQVIYLRDEPSVGRVVQWHGSSTWWMASLGVVLLVAGLLIVYLSYQFIFFRK